MAVPSNKSSSSQAILSRANLNSRNSESSNPIRRSFSGNPFTRPSIVANPRGFNPNTPANSPSDFTRRNSMGREGVAFLRDHEDKENPKDQNPKQGRVRSPASLKGMKNFMSPTISAASKIASSPRKKILAERNEPARTSLSFSNEKKPFRSVTFSDVVEDIDAKADTGLQEIKIGAADANEALLTAFSISEALRCEEVFDPEVPLSSETDSKSSSEGSDCVNLDQTFQTEVADDKEEAPLTASSISEALRFKEVFGPEVPLSSKIDSKSLSEGPACVNLDPTFKTEVAGDKEEAPLTASSISEALRCAEVFDPELPLRSEIDSKSLSEEPDCVKLDPTFKISPTSSCWWSCPMVAPLDADPSLLPYDPKANYLSPRPQFLHYRPNPRIELYRNKDGGGRRLEESFISGSFSDTEVTEETESDDSRKVNEDVSSVEPVKEEEQQEEIHVSETNPGSTDLSEDATEAKGGSKQRFFARSIWIGLLLVLSVAGLSISVSNTPLIDPSVLKVSNFFNNYDSYETAGSAKAKFDGLARNLFLWYANSISFVSALAPNFGGVHISGPLSYCNLTTLPEDILVDDLMFGHSHEGRGEKFEHSMLGSMRETEVDIEPLEEEGSERLDDRVYGGEVSQETEEVLEEHGASEFEEVYGGDVSQETEEVLEEHGASEFEEELQALEEDQVTELSNLGAEKTEEEVFAAGNHGSRQQSNYEEQPVMVPLAEEVQSEVSGAGELNGESETISPAKMDSRKVDVISESAEFYATKDGFFRENMLGIAALLLTLFTATVFIHVKKEKNTTSSAALNAEQPLPIKKLDFSPMSVSTEHIFLQRPSSRNWPTEVDMEGESCPSEMSSFQRSSSYSKKGGLKESSEAQSQKRREQRKNYKRESLASSSDYSMGSSYGSFTTYEKIPIKHHGHGDEETVTPVRRSSRFRKQVTSP
ncbi:uncharacterized protein LOC122314055 [Carya illinoinensis]|uniref:Uncharacterized protein n=2 Tax=Carya illinoinensis TaxID=32201 RepID=A0A8T1QD33_CARIL|nr:uncharacterized protein LOC122314055 [Carya illinoinensis]KAG6652144.1 hypothetical protein CIPAW_06G163200 [Carya illinoinensis]KAG6710069.1 hypothetical protein I3842_06G164400 [Carya illinoinensis]